jgi:hypothetical protein
MVVIGEPAGCLWAKAGCRLGTFWPKAAIVFKYKQADGRRQVDGLTLAIDFRNKSIGNNVLRNCDFLERAPKRAFQSHAAVTAMDVH